MKAEGFIATQWIITPVVTLEVTKEETSVCVGWIKGFAVFTFKRRRRGRTR